MRRSCIWTNLSPHLDLPVEAFDLPFPSPDPTSLGTGNAHDLVNRVRTTPDAYRPPSRRASPTAGSTRRCAMAGGREGARAPPPEADPHWLGGCRFAPAPVCQLPPVALDPASYATTDAVWASGLPSTFRLPATAAVPPALMLVSLTVGMRRSFPAGGLAQRGFVVAVRGRVMPSPAARRLPPAAELTTEERLGCRGGGRVGRRFRPAARRSPLIDREVMSRRGSTHRGVTGRQRRREAGKLAPPGVSSAGGLC